MLNCLLRSGLDKTMERNTNAERYEGKSNKGVEEHREGAKMLPTTQ